MQFIFSYEINNIQISYIGLKLNNKLEKIFDTFNNFSEKNLLYKYKILENTVILIKKILLKIEIIDKLISKYSPNWSINRMDLIDKIILRIAIYEILYDNDTPDIVSINEAIRISKKYSSSIKAISFINGILNTIKDNK